MWYGLFKGDEEESNEYAFELIAVQYFDREPSSFDFNVCLFSWNRYLIRELRIDW